MILLLAYFAVYSVRTMSALDELGRQGVQVMALAVAVMVLSLFVAGGYNRLWSRTSGHDVTVLVSGVVLASLVLIPIDFFWRPRPVPLSVIIVGNGMALMGFVAVRYRSRLISGLSWRWRAVWHQEFPDKARGCSSSALAILVRRPLGA